MKAGMIVTVGVVFLAVGGTARADTVFTLAADEELMVKAYYTEGALYDHSRVTVLEGGTVESLHAYDTSAVEVRLGARVGRLYMNNESTVDIVSGATVSANLYAYDTSTVDVSGGLVGNNLIAYNTSTVNMSGGQVGWLYTHDTSTLAMSGGQVIEALHAEPSSTASISGGTVYLLYAHDTSTVRLSEAQQVTYLYALGTGKVDISGGRVTGHLVVRDTSTVRFIAEDYHFEGGLSLHGDRLLGTGMLYGEWLDGTSWNIYIAENSPEATVLLVPEPATLGLLALGGLAIIRRRSKQ